uniref:Ig-like domain-containing protein n=1 Tax=Cyprinodon variegatus TaxID=28743 RepID=A0A3Q2G4M7_CYPVA
IRSLFKILIFFVFLGVRPETLRQPPSASVLTGERLEISCEVPSSLNSYDIVWIRQPAGKGLEWFSFNSKFSVITVSTLDSTVTLHGQNMQPEDSAVYYCARQPQ